MLGLKIFFDGLCEPKNPGGIATYGFVIFRGAVKIMSDSGLAGVPWTPDATNNVGEYTGLIKALEWVRSHRDDKDFEILGDSQLVVRQLTGRYSVHSPRLAPLFAEVKRLLEGCEWTAKWIPREENDYADSLSYEAYRKYCLETQGKVLPTISERMGGKPPEPPKPEPQQALL